MIGWLPWVRSHAHRLPMWVACAGAAALLLAALLSAVLAPRWQAQAAVQLAATQSALQSSLRPAPQPAVRATVFKSDLPMLVRTPERRAALMVLARRHGLAVQRAAEQADAAGQLQLTLAGQARYAALRAFVAAALLADPALVLDRLHMQRASATAPDLDVDLQWTLLHRSEPLESNVTPKVTRVAGAGP